MSHAQEQRLRRLEELATPTTRGSDIRRHLRTGLAEAPPHARTLLGRWRAAAAAMAADAHDDLDAALAELARDGFAIDAAMVEAAEVRLDGIEAARLAVEPGRPSDREAVHFGHLR
jgi:hypothetical protein